MPSRGLPPGTTEPVWAPPNDRGRSGSRRPAHLCSLEASRALAVSAPEPRTELALRTARDITESHLRHKPAKPRHFGSFPRARASPGGSPRGRGSPRSSNASVHRTPPRSDLGGNGSFTVPVCDEALEETLRLQGLSDVSHFSYSVGRGVRLQPHSAPAGQTTPGSAASAGAARGGPRGLEPTPGASPGSSRPWVGERPPPPASPPTARHHRPTAPAQGSDARRPPHPTNDGNERIAPSRQVAGCTSGRGTCLFASGEGRTRTPMTSILQPASGGMKLAHF